MTVIHGDVIHPVQCCVPSYFGVDVEGLFNDDVLNGDAHAAVACCLYLELCKAQCDFVGSVGQIKPVLAWVFAVCLIERVVIGAAHFPIR